MEEQTIFEKEESEEKTKPLKPRQPVESGKAVLRKDAAGALVGEVLDGRFLIESSLTESGADEGGMGLVYLAKDMKLLGKQTVVKILRQEALQNPDLVRKFHHEKEALIRLDHPNIVRILDSGALSNGNLFMVMDYIQGYSLRRKLKENGKLDFAAAAQIIEAVTNALSAAHSKKVLHRDIKPENIMLTPQEDAADERVRVIDFGIARVEEALLAPVTTVSRGIGTVLYIAPEQLGGELAQTAAVDIYSLATVAYEMLTGALPFQPQTPFEMFQMQKEGVKVPPRQLRQEIPEEAETLLLSALSFDPADRPQSIRAFGSELAKALRGVNFPVDESQIKTAVSDTAQIFGRTDADLKIKPTEPSIVSEAVEKQHGFSISNIPTPPRKNSKKTIWATALAALIMMSLAGIFTLIYLRNTSQQNSAGKNSSDSPKPETVGGTESPARVLAYHLNVQKMRDEKPYGSPFRSSGQEIFENGYKFKMAFESDAEGYIYLFNESSEGADLKTVYYSLYPTPDNNTGSKPISAGRQIETGVNRFIETPGTEILWLIWTKEKRDDLESAKQSAWENSGEIKDRQTVRNLSDFLQKYKQPNEVKKDSQSQQTIIKGTGDVLVQRIEIEHR